MVFSLHHWCVIGVLEGVLANVHMGTAFYYMTMVQTHHDIIGRQPLSALLDLLMIRLIREEFYKFLPAKIGRSLVPGYETPASEINQQAESSSTCVPCVCVQSGGAGGGRLGSAGPPGGAGRRRRPPQGAGPPPGHHGCCRPPAHQATGYLRSPPSPSCHQPCTACVT